jgi:regulator of nucleoside diphosphate kinase
LLVSECDYDRIADLALRIQASSPGVSRLLLEELDRATIFPNGSLPGDVVCIDSEVRFLDDLTGTDRRVTLVLPPHADIEEGRLSIITPVGAGLIGLSEGQEISWPCPDGRPRILRILEVRQPDPPRAAPAAPPISE